MIFKIIYYETIKDRLEDARVHCVVLKVRAVPTPQPATTDMKDGPREAVTTTRRLRLPVPQDPTACMCQAFKPSPFRPQAVY